MAASGAAAAPAAAAEVKARLDLSNDSLEKICHALLDPLTPQDAVALAGTCKGLRVPTAAVVAELLRRHEAAKALCRKAGTSCAAVGEAAAGMLSRSDAIVAAPAPRCAFVTAMQRTPSCCASVRASASPGSVGGPFFAQRSR